MGKISLIEPTGWQRWDRDRNRRRRQKRLLLRFLLPLNIALWASVVLIPNARAVVRF